MTRPDLGRRALSLALLLAAATLAVTLAAVPPARGGPTALTAACEGGRPALLDDPALEALPASAVFVIAARDPGGLLATFGWARLREALTEVREETREHTGRDLTDPASWEAIGLDVHGPAGFAWLGGGEADAAFWATVRDRAALRRFLEAVARREGGRFDAATVGDALVLQPERDHDIGFVFRGDVVFFTVTGGGDDAGAALARTIAVTPPAASLAHASAFRAQVGALGFGRDVTGWVALRPFLYEALGVRPPAVVTPSPLQRDLDRARNDGASAADVRSLRRMMVEERGWAEEAARQSTALRRLVDALAGPLAGLAFGFETRPRSIAFRAQTDLPDDALLRRLLRPGDGPPSIVRTLDETALVLSYARLDVPVLLDVVQRVVTDAGGDWDGTTTWMRERQQIDLDRDVRGVFSGEIGFAITGSAEEALVRPADMLRSLGGVVSFGVHEAARARRLVARLVAQLPLQEHVHGSADGWRLDIPGWRSVHVALAADQLVVTTDPDYATRLVRGVAGRWLAGLAGTPLGALLADDRAETVWTMDVAPLAFLAFGVRSVEAADGREGVHHDPARVAVTEPADPGGDAAAPRSEAWQALADERAAVTERIGTLRETIHRRRQVRLAGLVRALGTTAFVGHREGERFVTCGGQFFRAADLAAFVDEAVGHAAALLEIEAARERLWRLESDRWDLDERLRRQRAEDVRRWRERSRTGN